jgi:hypothetical protein
VAYAEKGKKGVAIWKASSQSHCLNNSESRLLILNRGSELKDTKGKKEKAVCHSKID